MQFAFSSDFLSLLVYLSLRLFFLFFVLVSLCIYASISPLFLKSTDFSLSVSLSSPFRDLPTAFLRMESVSSRDEIAKLAACCLFRTVCVLPAMVSTKLHCNCDIIIVIMIIEMVIIVIMVILIMIIVIMIIVILSIVVFSDSSVFKIPITVLIFKK